MKVDDIVEVRDGSYSMFYAGDGKLNCVDGNGLRGRRFRVLAIGESMPTYLSHTHRWTSPPKNDLMLCEVKAPEHVLFTQVRFCRVVDRSTKVDQKVEIVVPFGTEVVVIHTTGVKKV